MIQQSLYNKKDLEDIDELHYTDVPVSFKLIESRKKYIYKDFFTTTTKSSVFKLVKLLSVNNIKELNNLGK